MWSDHMALSHGALFCVAMVFFLHASPTAQSIARIERSFSAITKQQLLAYLACAAELSEGIEGDCAPSLSP